MKFAAATLAAVSYAAITYATVEDEDIQTLDFTASSGTTEYVNWVASGTDDEDDSEGWYQLGEASSSDGDWTPSDSDDYDAAEAVLFVYSAVDGESGNDVQLFWQVNYAVASADTSVWSSVELVQTVYDYTTDNLVADDSDDTLSDDASASSAENAVMLSDNNGVWDSDNSVTPGHDIYMLMPEETTDTSVRITIGDSFTVYYTGGSDYATSAIELTSNDVMTDGQTGEWAAASSLTAAATVVVAATLF